VEVIEHDPILIMKILKLVNSSYFGLAQKITSVNHAVVYIGINTVKNLALSAATLGVLPRTNNADSTWMHFFYIHYPLPSSQGFSQEIKDSGKG